MSDDVTPTDDSRHPDRPGVPTRHSPARRAAIYTRTAGPISPASRNRHAAQEEECRQEADRLGLEVVVVVSDVGAPGTLEADNEGWQQIESLIRAAAVEVVLTSGFDRLTRSWADVGALYSLSVEFGVEFRTPSRSLTDDMALAALHVARKAPPTERRRPGRGGAPGHPAPTEGDH